MALHKFIKRTASFVYIFTFIFALTGNASAPGTKFNMSYIYSGQPSDYIAYIDSTKGAVNAVSPDFFNLNPDGTLKLTSKVTTSFVNEMHKRNIKVIPFLSNHWDRTLGKSAFKNRWSLAQQITDTIKRYNLDGINIDIENMTEIDRNDYVDFVKVLRSKLPVGKTVSVAVASNIKESDTGWAGSYDYTALSEHSDFIMVMAYDEHYGGGPEGPVASTQFVESAIKYALKKVPKNKIVLGIPFYGRYWKQGESYGGYGIDMSTAETLIRKYNGQTTFDEISKSPQASISIKSGSTLPTVGYRQLTPGNYTIWYENETSLKHKLSLVQKYDLKGTASWSLGQETQDTWDYYDLWLNGHYFEDIMWHWAQDSIINIMQKGWMNGTSAITFLPNNCLTRAQTAVILTRVLGLELTQTEYHFTDTVGHWAEREINTVRQHEILLGKGANIFAPDEPVTREQMAVILERTLTSLAPTTGKQNPYKDVNCINNSWSYNAILKMNENSIFYGYPDGLFHPYEELTRAQMAVLLERISPYMG